MEQRIYEKRRQKTSTFSLLWSQVIVSLPRGTCKLKNTHIIISLAGNCIKDTTTFLSFEIQIAVIFPRFGYFIHAMELHGTSNYGSGVEFLTFILSTHTIYANKQTNKKFSGTQKSTQFILYPLLVGMFVSFDGILNAPFLYQNYELNRSKSR